MKDAQRLGVVLRLREIEERRAQATAARAAGVARSATAQAQDARGRYERRPAPEGSLGPVQLRALQLQGDGALERYHEAVRDRNEANEASKGANDALSMAMTRRKSAERLVERRDAETARVAQAAAQRALDELFLLSRAAWH